MKMSEILAQLDGTAYVVRRSLHDVKNIRKAKKAILTALKVQEANLGFSMVELLSTCPTNWGMTPLESMEWVESDMIPYYPLGDYKVIDAVKEL
jgi:2-oxoglutarate ferredoxin oxidoreductase subunit beta